MTGTILELQELDVFYGPIQALKKVSMHIEEDRKSTRLNSSH